MSWDSHITCLTQDQSGIFTAGAIWGKDPLQLWTTADPELPLQEKDIRVLLGDTTKFKLTGPTLMGTKFMMVQDKLDDETVLCMSLKAMNAPTPYFLVFGFLKTGIYIAKVTAPDVKPAVNPVFNRIDYLKKSGF